MHLANVPATSPLKTDVLVMSAPLTLVVSFKNNGLVLVPRPPKAEVMGSNPVGCANDFNKLAFIFTSECDIISPLYPLYRKAL